MSRESLIDGMALGFRSSGPQMRGYYLAHFDEKDVHDMLKLLGIKKQHMDGAMALVTLMRRKPE